MGTSYPICYPNQKAKGKIYNHKNNQSQVFFSTGIDIGNNGITITKNEWNQRRNQIKKSFFSTSSDLTDPNLHLEFSTKKELTKNKNAKFSLHLGTRNSDGNLVYIKEYKKREKRNEIHDYETLLITPILKHENIIDTYGYFKKDGNSRIMVAFEKYSTTWNDYTYPLPLSTVQNYIKQILKGLKFLHEKNIAFGCFSLNNIVINGNSNKSGSNVIKLNYLQIDKMLNPTSVQIYYNLLTRRNSNIKTMKKTDFLLPPYIVKTKGVGITDTIYKNFDFWYLGCLILKMVTGNDIWEKKIQENKINSIDQFWEMWGSVSKSEWAKRTNDERLQSLWMNIFSQDEEDLNQVNKCDSLLELPFFTERLENDLNITKYTICNSMHFNGCSDKKISIIQSSLNDDYASKWNDFLEIPSIFGKELDTLNTRTLRPQRIAMVNMKNYWSSKK